MKIIMQIDVPETGNAAPNIVAARQLLNELLSAEQRVPADLKPSEQQTPIRTPAGDFVGYWQVTQ